ncbi:MAG: DUF2007 domain-containing protein [Clostridia bacterium]|nr:DUF2007 domain-containing protein [Clostridia bacterium]
MDRFFGLDYPALKEEGLSLLATLYDDLLVQMYEALLKEEQIPYLKKDRSGGSAIRILMGNNPHGTDIYVPESFLDRARDLLAVDENAVDDDDTDATTDENTD